ncbi:alpha/beta fold hydrolase [Falsiroseomonas selenitidurans]|uniref:Alpha/beta fold hydrolase n=1 Tax=Falsiroseomonas selenitidurans TaxID=2716335 RepID=A0ABX1DXD6_9PROT|nr:alpha/beta fold hydrolase [Falsiroseomonas selenitidurans]NKC29564.1 alpha/beta fold hydrolase [Falsiroseomonas selenitidurans]
MIHPDGTPVPPLPDLRFCAVDAVALGLAGPRLSYMEAGHGGGQGGATILLLHGIGANSMGWRFLLAGLAPRARVIAWNAPGYLLSDGFTAAAPAAAHYAEAAVALLAALGVAGPVLVAGSSFGSMLGACLAARHPGRVARLALLGTSRGQRWKNEADRAAMLAMREASVAEGGVALARTRSDRLVAPGAGPVVRGLVQGMVAATDARGLMQAARCTDLVDVTVDFAPHIVAPTLAITGAEDLVNPPEGVGRPVAAAIPGARFLVPEGIGHLPELEAPARTLALLQAHFFGE